MNTASTTSQPRLSERPVFAHLLGLSPLLAVADRGGVALGLALVTALILLLAAVALSMAGKRLRGDWRFVGYLLLLALLVTVLEWTLSRLLPAFTERLGIYLPLLCCNFIIVTRLDAFRTRGIGANLRDAANTGAAYGLALLVFALPRELLATGAVFTDLGLLAGADAAATGTTISTGPAAFAASAPAAFLLLGLLVAAWHWFARAVPERQRATGSIEPAQRARVTGRLKNKSADAADQTRAEE